MFQGQLSICLPDSPDPLQQGLFPTLSGARTETGGLFNSHLLEQCWVYGNVGRLAVVQFESLHGGCTPDARVLKSALSTPALETSAGRSSGVECYELKRAVSKHW